MERKKHGVGYITGNFDLLHADHLHVLERASALCRTLIVGLTTDELATKTKRRPVFAYEHRRALLLSTSYVDVVVPHVGRRKSDDHSLLGFDILITSEEYRDSDEMVEFTTQCPKIPVAYLSRGRRVSTSSLLQELTNRLIPRVLATSITGVVNYNSVDDSLKKHINQFGKKIYKKQEF